MKKKDMFGFDVFEELANNYMADSLEEEQDREFSVRGYDSFLDDRDDDNFYNDDREDNKKFIDEERDNEYSDDDIEELDEDTSFPSSAVPVFEHIQNSGKKLWVVNYYDLYRFMECCKITNAIKAVDKIMKDKEVPEDGHINAILIPQDALDTLKKTMIESDGHMSMPTKLGELGRFANYLKNNCINKGIQIVTTRKK